MCLSPTTKSSKNRQAVKATDNFWSGHNENKENNSSRSAKDFPLSSPIKRNKPSDMIVVLDLDETLVHCTRHDISEVPKIKHFKVLRLKYRQGEETRVLCVRERPKLRSFLEVLSDHFEVHVFTRGSKGYADVILDVLEDFQRGKYFAKRWYRHNCTRVGRATWFKDLSQISSDLSRIVLVDDRIENFRENPQNGIPISEFRGQNRHDNELMALWRLLRVVNCSPDVRPVIDSMYGDETRKCLAEEDYQAFVKHLETERGEEVPTTTLSAEDDDSLLLDHNGKDTTPEPPRLSHTLRSMLHRIVKRGASVPGVEGHTASMAAVPMNRVRAHTGLHDH